MQNGVYSLIWWSVIALKFVVPFVSLCFPITRHYPKLTVAVALGIIVGTLLERFVWIAGIDGTGTVPVLWGPLVNIGIIMVGYQLVRSAMARNQLIRG
jgi:hypothetical protein